MIERWLQITCDGCGDTEPATVMDITTKEFRSECKKKYGWKNYGKLDYCPKCIENGKAKKRCTDML